MGNFFRRSWAWLSLLLASPFLVQAEPSEESFGFLFERFQLTLEQGYRTEAVGPLFYHNHEDDNLAETWAFPPLYSYYRDPSVLSHENDFLYPIFSSIHYGKERRWQFLELFSGAGGQMQDDSIQSRFTVFPFYFQQRSTNPGENYTAVGPFFGHLQNRLWRDRIFFVMFPFYSETQKRDIVTDNYLYPIVHVREGNGLHGWGVWPLVGHQHKIVTHQTNGFGDVSINGGHDHWFVLWPLWLKQDNRVGTTNAETLRASIPLFVYDRSASLDLTTVIWPFFTSMDNREKKYREWQMPWPFIIFARGEGKTTSRVFPLFQSSHNNILESDFFLWPIYTYRRTHSAPLDYQRTRIVFYLYAHIREKNTKTGQQKSRLDMWPFFTWHQEFDGNERLQVLAPLEPMLPNNRGVERNWSPLWSLWRAENNPRTGTRGHSLLWNLYRDERSPNQKRISFLFGMFQHHSGTNGSRTRLFFVTVAKSSPKPGSSNASNE